MMDAHVVGCVTKIMDNLCSLTAIGAVNMPFQYLKCQTQAFLTLCISKLNKSIKSERDVQDALVKWTVAFTYELQ